MIVVVVLLPINVHLLLMEVTLEIVCWWQRKEVIVDDGVEQ